VFYVIALYKLTFTYLLIYLHWVTLTFDLDFC